MPLDVFGHQTQVFESPYLRRLLLYSHQSSVYSPCDQNPTLHFGKVVLMLMMRLGAGFRKMNLRKGTRVRGIHVRSL